MATGLTVDSKLVERLILAAAPERTPELHAHWANYGTLFMLMPDEPKLRFSMSRRGVYFSHKTMRHDWLVGFSAWEAFTAYSPAIVASGLLQLPLDPALLKADSRLPQIEESIDGILYTARELRMGQSVDDLRWPTGIPEPVDRGDDLPVVQRLTFELICIATAAMFLHELRHVRFAADGDSPADARDEESACDEYARTFLLDRAPDYAASSGYDIGLILEKRLMGLALAAFIIHEQTPRTAQQSGTDSHPGSVARFEALTGNTISDDNRGWHYASSLAMTALRRANRLQSAVTRLDSPKAVFDQLVQMLR